MVRLVAIGVALFALAILVVVATQTQELAALFAAFRAAPLPAELAWAVIVLAALVLVPGALWFGDKLRRQRKALMALESRLDGVRQAAKDLAGSQIDAEAALHHLARTDPEGSIAAIEQRLPEAERIAELQDGRNAITDLQSRVDAVRGQQQRLKERLAPVLERRRSIEQLFVDLDSRQSDIERALAEIASGDDAVALEVRLKELNDFVSQGNGRCDAIEEASQTIAVLKDEYSELGVRLAPFAAKGDGVTSRVKALSAARDGLAAQLESLNRTPQGMLPEFVQTFTVDKKRLEDSVMDMGVQFSKLATLREDIERLYDNFERALDLVTTAADGGAAANAGDRVTELSSFIAKTQAHVGDIERKLATFIQLRTRLGELHTRVVSLDNDDGGVVSVIKTVQENRNQLATKLGRLEQGDDGDLAARVKSLTETKRELEQRVAAITEQFSQLVTIRKDIAGLFEKLNGAMTAAN